MIDAVGEENVGGEPLPRCMPHYTFVFASAAGEIATFGGVCGGAQQVILVYQQHAFLAQEGAAQRALLGELAMTAPATP